MTPPLLIAFAVVFAVGPFLFVTMMRPEPSKRVLKALGIGTVAIAVAGAFLSARTPLVGLACLWLAWVAALAFTAQAIRRIWAGHVRIRWIRVTGALATTIPWFGLATAQMMTQ